MSRVIEYKNASSWIQNTSFSESSAAGTYYSSFIGNGTGSRIVTEFPERTYGDSFTVSIASGFSFAAIWLDSDKRYIGRSTGYIEWSTASPRTVSKPTDAVYIIMYLRRNSGTLLAEDVQEANLTITYANDNLSKVLASDGISLSETKTIEEIVSQHSTSISNNATNIALKANASDVYTKTETDGLIATEASNRQSAIEQSAEQINLSVSETYSTKTELSDSVKQTDTASGNIIQISGPIDNFVIDGKSEQITTTGKNLFDKSTAIAGTYINSSGATASGSSNSTTPFIPIIEGQTYTVSYPSNNGAGNYLAWYNSDDISSVVGNRVDLRNAESSTATAPSNANYVRFSFTTSMLNSVQFEQGSVATDYEPYTGLKPAPSPDYPQDINSVNTVFLNVGGKNLFNKEEAANYLNWLNGTYRRFPVHVPPNTKITISHNGPTKISNFYMCFAKWSGDWSGVPLSHPGAAGQSNQGTITSDETGVLYIKIYPNSEASVNTFLTNYADNLQVEIGDTVSEYEEYTSVTSNYIVATAFDDINDPNKNTYTTNGGQPFQYDAQAGGYYTPIHKIVGLRNQIPGTYYKVSFWGKNREGTQSYSILSNAIGNKFPSSVSGYPNEWTYYEAAWRVPDNGNLDFVIYNQVYIKDFKITLAKGVVPILLNDNSCRSLSDDVYDTIILEYESPSTIDGWGVYRKKLLQRTKERILNGSEDWIRAGSAPFNIYYKEYDSVITNDTQTVAQVDIMSDHFKYYGPYYTGSNRSSNGIVVGGDGSTYTTICVDAREICDPTDVSTFKTWLSQNNTKLVFPLASPITKDLGTVELPIITEEMSAWVISNPTTNISAEWYTNMGLGIFSKLNTDALGARMTSAESSITQNAENINLKVSKDGVISSINQSAESVKIQASKVEIDGAAIFTNSDFQSQLNNQNYATTTQVATAKSEAISAAATDATNKANTAQQNAISLIPTDISELNNDAGYQTSSDVDTTISSKGYQTSSQVENAITSKGYATTTQAQGYASTAEQNAKTYAEGQVSTVNSSLEAYKTSTNSTLTALQNQVDGQIEAWYKSTDPTTSNEPASTWNTDVLKARHEGDIYYNVENGHSWRWMKSGNTYSWQQIPDSDAAAALAAAQNAQTLANSKRRIFTSTPTPPYDIGDLWVNGSSIQYCSTSKSETQTYAESDWTLTATDDSSALDAISALSNQLGNATYPYQEVEWIESNGKQFIYLDWKPIAETFGFEADFLIRNTFSTSAGPWNATTNIDGFGNVFGVRNSSMVNDFQLGSYNSNGLIRLGNKDTTAYITRNTRQTCSLIGDTYTDPTGTARTITKGTTVSDKPYHNMTVFAMYEGATRRATVGSLVQPGSVRIYSLKFYEDTTIAVNLTPAVRLSDNVAGLWDSVSNHFYPARGAIIGEKIADHYFGEIYSITKTIETTNPSLITTNTVASRLWTADAPTLDNLIDGQQITITPVYNSVSTVRPAELSEWDESTTSAVGNVYIKLTLANNKTTEWVPVYYSANARLTTHYVSGAPLTLTYHENMLVNVADTGGSSVVRGWFQQPDYNTNTTYNLGQNIHATAITAKEAITRYHLIMGDALGYQNVAAGDTFDISYPLLLAYAAAIAVTKTSAATYETYPAADFSYNGTIEAGAANKMLYLKGTISGNTFTVAASPFMTTVVPNEEDGYLYIPLGIMSSVKLANFVSSKDLYAYLNGTFRQVSASTTVATQKLYYRTTSLTAPAAPTTWITTNNPATYNTWNLAVPPLAASKEANATKYPYLYSVEQQKRVDGTVITGAVSNDSNTTIIDGGSIITNSVTATQIAAGTITANEISSGAITTDKLDANAVTAAKIDATDLHVSAANIDGTITFGQLSGVQASGDYALSSDIPQDISDLNNDTGFITSADVPTKVSDLTNDSGFQTSSQVDTAITSKGYATTDYADGKASAAEQAAKSYAETQAGAVQTALNTEINQRKAQYGISSTAAGTAAKAVTCANFELEAGNEIIVKFTTANTSAAKVQLNVNSKGAKDIWVGNAVTSASNQLLWGANTYITFKYDGTQFQVIGEPRTWYGACTTAQATAAKTATITGCVVCKGAKVELAMTYANSAASPTLNISSVGAKNIYFGTGTTQPLISNGTSWLQSNTATFTFDGAVWRTQGKTYIDANSIVTGYISADRIEAGSISGDKITGGTLAIGAFPSTTQADILNSNIHVPSTVAELTDSSTYATKTDAQGYADGKDSAIAAAAKRTDVSIAVTAINYTNNTATLQATLYIDGTATTSGVTYKWLKDGTVISGQTSRTLSVTSAMGLSHVYSCTVTYS